MYNIVNYEITENYLCHGLCKMFLQIVDYASRKGVNQAEVETLLASYLSY